MKCTFCNNSETKVIDSRESDDLTRRRRECLKCEKRFTTYERVKSVPMYVIKKDGSREMFDREKL
ncbi:MAG: transcriptional regulator NrdR, partial [Nanoarchaeota archaeon]